MEVDVLLIGDHTLQTHRPKQLIIITAYRPLCESSSSLCECTSVQFSGANEGKSTDYTCE